MTGKVGTRKAERGTGRDGFALITVLWLITALSAVVGLALASTRLGALTTRNRIALARGRWAAEACLGIAQARWAESRLADTATIDLGRGTTCAWEVEDPTSRVNVNSADREVLERLLGSREQGAVRSVVDAVIEARRRGKLEDVAQVGQLAGWIPGWTDLITVDGPGTVNANAAARAVLAALPGMSGEAVERILYRKSVGRPIRSLDELVAELSPNARAALLERYADLARQITFSAPQLRLSAYGWVAGLGGRDRLHATTELLVVPLPDRLAAIRRRMR